MKTFMQESGGLGYLKSENWNSRKKKLVLRSSVPQIIHLPGCVFLGIEGKSKETGCLLPPSLSKPTPL